MRRFGLAALLVATVISVACSSKSDGHLSQAHDPAPPTGTLGPPTFTLFALAEVRGQIGPCGCTSDPLGDIARTARLVAAARAAGPTLVVDAGSLLYSKAQISSASDAQEELKADLLVKTWQEELGVAALGLGPMDLSKGPGKVRPARQAVNVSGAGVPLEAPKLVELGGAKVGIFGVVQADALPVIEGLVVGDPVAAGKRAVSDLRAKGAQVIVGLVQATSRKDAAKLVRDIGGIDLAVAGLGKQTPEPEFIDPEAQAIGAGWLVVPADRGQVVSRFEVTLRSPAGPLIDAVGPTLATSKLASFDRQLTQLDTELKRFLADPTADPSFVAQKQRERAAVAAQRSQLVAHPMLVPATGPYFTFAQVRIAKGLACSPDVQSRVFGYFKAAGEANVNAAAGIAVATPAKGQAHYVGDDACEDCHSDAVDFWKATRHSHAWETLEERGQQFDLDCIGCHVTGWQQPGGSNLAFNEGLRDVQCETCHGPASIHLAKGGEDKPTTMARTVPKALCAGCHTVEHSDTFQYEAYLRDVTGKGHGEDLRKQLGDGPTGGALRKAALDRAGRTLGAGCTK